MGRNPAFWLLVASVAAIVVGAYAAKPVVDWAYRIVETGPESAPFIAELQQPGDSTWWAMPDAYFTREDAARAAEIYIRQQERMNG